VVIITLGLYVMGYDQKILVYGTFIGLLLLVIVDIMQFGRTP